MVVVLLGKERNFGAAPVLPVRRDNCHFGRLWGLLGWPLREFFFWSEAVEGVWGRDFYLICCPHRNRPGNE